MYVSHSGIRKKKPALHLPTCPYAKNKEKLLPPLPQPKKKKIYQLEIFVLFMLRIKLFVSVAVAEQSVKNASNLLKCTFCT